VDTTRWTSPACDIAFIDACREVAFIEPMECLSVPKLPDGPEWVYEIKLDDAGRPNFDLLQHFRSEASRICYVALDLLILKAAI
jgi:hypothetical protein